MFGFNNHHQGAYCLGFAKVTVTVTLACYLSFANITVTVILACYLSFANVTVTVTLACYLSFAKVTVATVTCRNILNVNFHISFKAKLLCISW